jgi:6-phosphofructokinase
MFEELSGNVLIVQTSVGGAATNAVLAGIVTEALNHGAIEDVYGCMHGVQGLLHEEFIDLADESQQTIRALSFTPGAILGTGPARHRNAQDTRQIFEILQAHNIRYFFVIGSREGLELAHAVSAEARQNSYDVRVIAVPTSGTNDIAFVDHAPGYGCAVKNLAAMVRELSCELQGRANRDCVAILEVAGKQGGWVAAGSILAKRKGSELDAPHVVCLPEKSFSAEQFLAKIQAVLQKGSFCFVVTGEGLVDNDGNYIIQEGQNGMHTSDYLGNLIKENLDLKTETVRVNAAQLAQSRGLSKADIQEAIAAGKAAVTTAIEGKTDKMVTLQRGENDQYTFETGSVAIEEVMESAPKAFPESWISESGPAGVSHQFFKYANPLIQGEVEVIFDHGMPRFATLSMKRVAKKRQASTVLS